MLVIFLDFLLCGAGAWDLYVLKRYGLNSGLTVSWMLYEAARSFPAVGVGAGFFLAWVVITYQVPLAVAVFIFVCGHIFATMRGAT